VKRFFAMQQLLQTPAGGRVLARDSRTSCSTGRGGPARTTKKKIEAVVGGPRCCRDLVVSVIFATFKGRSSVNKGCCKRGIRAVYLVRFVPFESCRLPVFSAA